MFVVGPPFHPSIKFKENTARIVGGEELKKDKKLKLTGKLQDCYGNF